MNAGKSLWLCFADLIAERVAGKLAPPPRAEEAFPPLPDAETVAREWLSRFDDWTAEDFMAGPGTVYNGWDVRDLAELISLARARKA